MSPESIPAKGIKRHLVQPGEYRVTSEPVILTTLLGSCVSVCLFDPVARLMGMNHFLLPMRNPASREPVLATEAGRYGVWAMELLINDLLKHGAHRERLRAKAFGGANVLYEAKDARQDRFNIGEANLKFVRQFLKDDGIPLVAQDLGGRHGRQIHFYGGDYSVFLRRIPRARIERILSDEQHYLQNATTDRPPGAPAEFF
ncbi:chemotaxis protein CheD [Thermochromatium tepidum]|uniref:Probable chemoreceptor glutamine deamidase CheD n=1 Tax=Thermochromatium tepidum ATCC 43061 TaxID=316276 RepID=A0A6I6E0Y6_THETI|nr:chemotaxis protein CheD [Thermochromatium tepidum]QGU32595.1 chemotaxis protein CheD [Thermochromatium tepidum ATCC 43061]